MSDDIRHWADEGATAEELSLLANARAEQPDPAARLRTLQALGLAGGAPSPSGGGPGPAGPGAGAGLSLVKLAAVVLLVGGAIAGVKRARRAPASTVVPSGPVVEAPPAPPPAVTPIAPTQPGPPAAGAPLPAPQTTAAPARNLRRRAPAAAAPRAAEPPTLAAEVQALEQAQRALATRDPAAALRALDRYQADFPAGKLAAEGVVLRVRALLLDGQRAPALALAKAFAARHPDGAYTRQLDALVGGGGDAGAAQEKK